MDIYRIIDSNLNRLSEGLRVIEEYFRFLKNDFELTSQFKKMRQNVNNSFRSVEEYKKLLTHRDVESDIGSTPTFDENNIDRNSIVDVLRANFKRVEESARVLEEYSKLIKKKSNLFKSIRFQLYDLEKKIFTNFNREK